MDEEEEEEEEEEGNTWNTSPRCDVLKTTEIPGNIRRLLLRRRRRRRRRRRLRMFQLTLECGTPKLTQPPSLPITINFINLIHSSGAGENPVGESDAILWDIDGILLLHW